MNISVVIPSYNGVLRTSFLLSSIEELDPEALNLCRISVYEDPSNSEVAKRYDFLAKTFPYVRLFHIPTWSNMHGAAQYAFEQENDAEWVVYLGDDVLVTPRALTNMLRFIRENSLQTVALIQFPYWNAHDLTPSTEKEYPGPPLLASKEDMYTQGFEWLRQVPRNPHWDGDGTAGVYVNVNGVGFACHRPTWESVGGFCMETWCLDESISVRVWTKSNRGIVRLPGPPLVHYFGAASDHPPHDLHTEEAWIRGMGLTKKEAGELSYKLMFERQEVIEQEMRRARYSVR